MRTARRRIACLSLCTKKWVGGGRTSTTPSTPPSGRSSTSRAGGSQVRAVHAGGPPPRLAHSRSIGRRRAERRAVVRRGQGVSPWHPHGAEASWPVGARRAHEHTGGKGRLGLRRRRDTDHARPSRLVRVRARVGACLAHACTAGFRHSAPTAGWSFIGSSGGSATRRTLRSCSSSGRTTLSVSTSSSATSRPRRTSATPSPTCASEMPWHAARSAPPPCSRPPHASALNPASSAACAVLLDGRHRVLARRPAHAGRC